MKTLTNTNSTRSLVELVGLVVLGWTADRCTLTTRLRPESAWKKSNMFDTLWSSWEGSANPIQNPDKVL